MALLVASFAPATRLGAQEAAEVYRVGDEGSGQTFGSIAGMAYLDDGSLLVLDVMAREVVLLNAEGHEVGRVGRPGGGPGEFINPMLIAAEGDEFAIMDSGTRRISRYQGGKLVSTASVEGLPIGLLGFLENELVAITISFDFMGMNSGEPGSTVIAIDGRGRTRALAAMPDLVFEARRGSIPPIFNPSITGVVLPDETVMVGRTDEYNFAVLDRSGNELRRVGRDITRREVPTDLRRRTETILENPEGKSPPPWLQGVENLPPTVRAQFLQTLTFAPYLPVAVQILALRDRLLVARGLGVGDNEAPPIGDGIAPPWFDVFDLQGRYCGVLRLPQGFRAMAARGTAVAGLQDNPLDVPVVRVLDVELPPGPCRG